MLGKGAKICGFQNLLNRESGNDVQHTLFEITVIKSYILFAAMAGNIIPAIATTNAIVAGMIVTEALKVVFGAKDRLRNASLCLVIMKYSFFSMHLHVVLISSSRSAYLLGSFNCFPITIYPRQTKE